MQPESDPVLQRRPFYRGGKWTTEWEFEACWLELKSRWGFRAPYPPGAGVGRISPMMLWGGSWGVDRGCVWLFARRCHLMPQWPGEDEAPGELHSPSAPHMAVQQLPHAPSNYPPPLDPSHLWASTTETTPAPKGCQGRKELLPCAPEHRLEGRDDTGTPLGLLGEKGPPGAMSGDTYQARWCLNGALINGRIWTNRDGGCTAKAGIRKPGVGGWAEAESDTLWLWVSSQRKLYTSSGGILPSTW